MTNDDIKKVVMQKYAEIAKQDQLTNATSCCGSGPCSTEVYNIMNDDYSKLDGYVADADLSLGCGLPTQFAMIKPGNTVVDLGSGAGNDCFVARHETGESGQVIGIDFTQEMIDKAELNVNKLGFNNVTFRKGDIEDIPMTSNKADVVVSNCVLNLVPNKKKAFSEIKRILKPGGHFSISDVVLEGELPKELQEAAEMYAGCVSGAIQKNDYLNVISECDFQEITIQKQKPIDIPDDILSAYISNEDLKKFRESGVGIYSITVFGKKPLENTCCSGSNCC